jgi:cytoskeletal protein RodZ
MFEIGNSLREARLRQGLDFPQLEQSTKIRGKYLRALEEEQFEVLPAQTYVKGFLRTYADYLGLDGQLYVDEYNSRYVVDHDEPLRPRRVSPRSRQQRRVESRVLALTLLGIAVVTALVIAAWKFGGGNGNTILPTVTGSTATSAGSATHAAGPPPLLLVRGLRRSSLLQVRARSATGRPLFAGTLERGDVQRFEGPKRLWIEIDTPENVRVIVGGRTIRLRHGRPLTAIVSGRRLLPLH